MGIDAVIRSLAFAESSTSDEALMTIAQHREELARALATARATGQPSHEARQEAELREALRQHHAIDKKA